MLSNNFFQMFKKNIQILNNIRPGFTLIEILVTMGIFMMVMMVSGDYVITGLRSTKFNSEQETQVENARSAMSTMTWEIRGANSSQRGDYPLSAVNDNDLVFYADNNDDGLMERIRYFLSGTQLLKVVTRPDASNNYNSLCSTTTVANYMNNGSVSIFQYYDSNLVQTAVINNIRLIRIRVRINVTPDIAPGDYDLESDVNLRNLKSNL
jgi:type II secretory pathway pseudopilin PulG